MGWGWAEWEGVLKRGKCVEEWLHANNASNSLVALTTMIAKKYKQAHKDVAPTE